jgi:hypothetical protein
MIYTPNITLSGTTGIPGLIYAQPSGGLISVKDLVGTVYGGLGFTSTGAPRVVNKDGDESIQLCMDNPYDATLDYKNNGFVDEILRIGVTTSGGTSGLTSSFGTGIPTGIIINSNTSKILSGVTQSAIIGGVLITATTDNTVYVPNLNIGTVGTIDTGTSATNLGINSSGDVISTSQFIKRTLVKSEILALSGTPVELIPAPGPNKIIAVQDVRALYKFSVSGYTDDGSGPGNYMGIGFSGYTAEMSIGFGIFENEEDWYTTDNVSGGSGIPAPHNTPVHAWCPADYGVTDPSGNANGTLQIDIWYYIMDST